jgi:hypothetical protein
MINEKINIGLHFLYNLPKSLAVKYFEAKTVQRILHSRQTKRVKL